jgi:hypothetical protein
MSHRRFVQDSAQHELEKGRRVSLFERFGLAIPIFFTELNRIPLHARMGLDTIKPTIVEAIETESTSTGVTTVDMTDEVVAVKGSVETTDEMIDMEIGPMAAQAVAAVGISTMLIAVVTANTTGIATVGLDLVKTIITEIVGVPIQNPVIERITAEDPLVIIETTLGITASRDHLVLMGTENPRRGKSIAVVGVAQEIVGKALMVGVNHETCIVKLVMTVLGHNLL